MTDPTTQQAAPPTFESVRAKAHDLLLEIDNSQVHTEISQFIIAGRAQVVAALSFVEAHFHAFEVKAAAAVKAAEAKVSAIPTTFTLEGVEDATASIAEAAKTTASAPAAPAA